MIKYNIIICNIRKIDDIELYQQMEKSKRSDYTIKYNAKMNNNMEMKTVNVKRKGENCVYYKRK